MGCRVDDNDHRYRRKADEVAHRIKFNMGISSNYFMELAKFPPLAWCGHRLLSNISPNQAFMQDDGSCNNFAFQPDYIDAHMNLLRSQTETMSAALAGVDSITTTPFDVPFKTPDAFSERARNQQFLLKEEPP